MSIFFVPSPVNPSVLIYFTSTQTYFSPNPNITLP